MVEHKIITFHKQDVIEALEDYYKKINDQIIDINFDQKSLEYSNIREITIKVVAMNTEGLKGELEPSYELGAKSEGFSGFLTGNSVWTTTTGPVTSQLNSPNQI